MSETMCAADTEDTTERQQIMVDMLDGILNGIVNFKEDIHISSVATEDSMCLTFSTNPDDSGCIIGRRGATIDAIRTLFAAAARTQGYTFTIRYENDRYQ